MFPGEQGNSGRRDPGMRLAKYSGQPDNEGTGDQAMGRRSGVSTAAAAGASVLRAAPLLAFAAFLPLAFASNEAQYTATEPAQAAIPPQAGGSVAVDALLKDARALVAWMEDHNKDVLAAATRVEQAQAELRQGRLIPNPALSGTISDLTVGTTNPPGLTRGDTAIYGTTLSETVEIGKRGPRIRSADLRLQSERNSYLDTLNDKTAEARYALGRIAYLGARQSILEESLSAARQNVDIQRSRLENGDLSGSDFDRLQIDTMLLESEVASNRQEYEGATVSCGALLAAPCRPEGLDIETIRDAAPVPPDPNVTEAIERRPDIRALLFDRDAARSDALLAHRRRLPDPNLSVGYTHDNLTISGDQPRTYLVSIGIPLPLFDRGQHDAARAEAHARELEWTAAATREHGRADVEALLRRKTTLEGTLDRLVSDAVPKSKGVLETTLGAVNQGGVSMTDLLLTRRTHIDLLLKVMDLQFDLFAVRNDLRRVLGLDAELLRAGTAIPEVTP